MKAMQQLLKKKSELKMQNGFNRFFVKFKDALTIGEINGLVPIRNLEELDENQKIYGVNTIAKATENEISFLHSVKYVKDLNSSSAGFCFIDREHKQFLTGKTKPVVVDNPHYAYTAFLNEMFFVPIFIVESGISPKATIHETAKIGKDVEIQPGVVVDRGVVIGDGCKICANAVINHDCTIGENTYVGANTTISYAEIGKHTIIHNGVNIGQCGFGFSHNAGFNYKIPQLCGVKIGDFVEIGAGTCIDRGAFGPTTIGNNTKIDNLVHIAHGVKVGVGCFMAAEAGVAGSSEIGNFVQLGGQCGIAGHIKIGDGVQVAAHSGVIADVEPRGVVGGYPAMPIKKWHRGTVIISNLINKKKK
ncbi:MAG: UDP-3-O-(3-hydroxymyristoyl)glucosamine N-acyltransferase [Rickettsiales bacterium]|jgi:UDP-3-O-[3-hydroxymyristoyl] glucosamine N-acyltransferase|nr:UDP-3-O-(3-hydroxymyristoyl)glucosamine N-acyltransferase [Rickettsiales bacterium]